MADHDSNQSHLPGSKKWYPKSGSEQEFWDRCERATTMRARGAYYSEIGAELDVDKGMAHRMVARYLRGASRFYPAIELRELIAHKYRELFRTTMKELSSLDGVADSIEKRLAFISRAESLITKEAQLYGMVGVGGDLNIYTQVEGDNSGKPLPTIEDQQRIREMARQLRQLRDGVVEEAKFMVEDQSNGNASQSGGGSEQGQEDHQSGDGSASGNP